MSAAATQDDCRPVVQIVVPVFHKTAHLNIQLFGRLVSDCQIQSTARIQSAHIKSQISGISAEPLQLLFTQVGANAGRNFSQLTQLPPEAFQRLQPLVANRERSAMNWVDAGTHWYASRHRLFHKMPACRIWMQVRSSSSLSPVSLRATCEATGGLVTYTHT